VLNGFLSWLSSPILKTVSGTFITAQQLSHLQLLSEA